MTAWWKRMGFLAGDQPAVRDSACAGQTAFPERIPIQYGQTVGGSIDDSRSFQQYSFSGRRGEVVEIIMEAVSGDLNRCCCLATPG
jgi:hypothetical protein